MKLVDRIILKMIIEENVNDYFILHSNPVTIKDCLYNEKYILLESIYLN
jgi:hypothetical protein